MAMLADNPDVFTRLRSEVLETLGPHGKVNPDNLKQMRYLRAVLNGKPLFLSKTYPTADNCSRDFTVVPKCVCTCLGESTTGN